MKQFLLLSTLFLMGCSTFYARGYQDPKLKPFIEEFEEAYGVTITYEVKFGKLDGKKVGVCYKEKNRWGFTKKSIVINEDYWHLDNYYALHQLMFHEFGHCTFDLDHDDRIEENKFISIMNSTAFGHYPYYEKHIEYYLEELWMKYNGLNETSKSWSTSQGDCQSF